MDSLCLDQLTLVEIPQKKQDAEGGILMAFPAEVRAGIYRELLVTPEPVLIRKPRMRTFRELATSPGNSSILYVNKEIHCEALRVFFTYNAFAVGNGVDAREASLAGLRMFVKFMPDDLVGLISKLQFNVYLRKLGDPSRRRTNAPTPRSTSPQSPSATATPAQLELQWSGSDAVPFDSGLMQSLGSPAEAASLRQVYQVIPKHFTGLTAVTFDWVLMSSPELIEAYRILPRESIVTLLSNAIVTVLTFPKLRQLRVWEDECVFTECILGKVLKAGVKIGKTIEFEHLRFSEGKSGRIRDGDKEQREIRIQWTSSGDQTSEGKE